MTQAIKKKLRSNEGASLMVALLFFVMCATVGSIILAAATASSGRLANLRKEDQSYYAITSAADLFAEMMEDKEVVIQAKLTVDSNGKQTPENGFADSSINSSELLLPKVISKYVDFTAWQYEDDFPKLQPSVSSISSTDFTIALADGSLAVTGSVTMDNAFNLIVVLSNNDSGESLTMKFKSVIQKEEKIDFFDKNMQGTTNPKDTRVTVSTKTYTISWIDPVME